MADSWGGGWRNPDYGFDPQGAGGGLASFIGGIFGHSDRPYQAAGDEYQKWINRAQQTQQPYADAGTGAIGDYQKWLASQKDPSGFINGLMNNYKESPYARYQQQQAANAGQNYGSASGLMGSTALMQQMQQNAANISSEDMNNWLKNVLGVNTQYGQGEKNLIDTGQNSANSLANLYNNAANQMGNVAYGEQQGKNQDFWNTIAGLGKIGLSFL